LIPKKNEESFKQEKESFFRECSQIAALVY